MANMSPGDPYILNVRYLPRKLSGIGRPVNQGLSYCADDFLSFGVHREFFSFYKSRVGSLVVSIDFSFLLFFDHVVEITRCALVPFLANLTFQN